MARLTTSGGAIDYSELVKALGSNSAAQAVMRNKSKNQSVEDAVNAYLGGRRTESAPSRPTSSSRSGGSSGGSSNATKTTIVTPGGVNTSGWIINGRTYLDPEGKTAVAPGTFVKAGGKWYEKQSDGSGKEVNTTTSDGSKDTSRPSQHQETPETVPEDGWDGPIRKGNKGYSDEPKKELLTAQELAEIYGITWDANEIYDLYKEGVEETYDQLAFENRAARNQLSDTLAGQYDLYNSTLRDQRAGAIQSGMSKGTAAAQEVLSLLGAQGQSADVLSEYTQMMNMQANTKSKALTDAKERAFQDSNFITQYLGNLGLGIYNADVQQDVAKLAAQAQMEAARIQSAGNIASANAAASRYQQPMDQFTWLSQNMTPNELIYYLTEGEMGLKGQPEGTEPSRWSLLNPNTGYNGDSTGGFARKNWWEYDIGGAK